MHNKSWYSNIYSYVSENKAQQILYHVYNHYYGVSNTKLNTNVPLLTA